ncbi:peptidoglycan editing factor PgeF [Xylophilus sp. GOD-11R]|uniref:peptidoglycan editing factor PgeF n=1 Tax=Xylophilus sp. GOD-11R TaxID=3089814 RepID=UPI00298C4589|nr:peptidoglycan editing factor PgeF [Xylophilus sp. GOD-11R]WPB58236.1 peptidoglycan editing factor PgeF [Xylophilus sp. GOD-11R]
MSQESERSAAADWLRPDWPAPPGVRAVFTTRGTGASAAPWDSFNLGDHVGDAPQAVAANRDTLRREIGALPFFLQQPHGTDCADLDALQADARPTADACVATRPGRACTVMVADCLPVLLCDVRGRVVAAAHAGWRGLAAGVLESAVHALRERTGETAAPLLAWLGPCIGPQAFEVGEEVRAAFVQADLAAAGNFTPGRAPGKWMADLAGLARRRLQSAGVERLFGNDSGPDWCTVGQPSRFFSHRRDAARLGGTGRMAAAIWRLA